VRHGLVGGVGGVEPGQICILRLCAVVWSFDSKVLASSGDSKGEERGLYKASRHKELRLFVHPQTSKLVRSGFGYTRVNTAGGAEHKNVHI
jgi:hypothetical protein